MALCRDFSKIFNVEKNRDLEIPAKGQSTSLKVVPFDSGFILAFYIVPLSKDAPFLGRLPKVDLIILEGAKMSVRTSVRPSTKSFFDFN